MITIKCVFNYGGVVLENYEKLTKNFKDKVYVYVGSFNNNSDTLMVSDPCYGLNTWCTKKIKALKGKWNVYSIKSNIESWGWRNAELLIVHDSRDTNPEDFKLNDKFILTDDDILVINDIGVDSGSVGFYDYDKYVKYHSGERVNEVWYNWNGNGVHH